jgi:hypothetical protein
MLRNDQLGKTRRHRRAWVRAAALQNSLDTAFIDDLPPVVLQAAMGVLDRRSPPDGTPNGLDRRVDVEIFVTQRSTTLRTLAASR